MLFTKKIEEFLVVADEGNLTRAAEKLYISQSALTKQMNSLEESLGFKLLERSNKGVCLTKAGENFYSDMKVILRLSQEAIDKGRRIDSEDTILRVGFYSLLDGMEFQQISDSFSACYPNVNLTFSTVPFDLSAMQNAILSHKIDVSLVEYSEEFEKNGIQFDFLYEDTLSFMMSPLHPLSGKEHIGISDLEGSTVIVPQRGESEFVAQSKGLLDQCGAGTTIEYRPTGDFDLLKLQMSNNQIMLSASRLCKNFPQLACAYFDCDIKMRTGLISSRESSATAQRFISFAKEYWK